jgi:ABC-2 type transport system permease protein
VTTSQIQLMAVIRKEIAQIRADKRMAPMLVIMPTIMLFIFGNAVNFDVDHVATVVVDHDGTARSREELRRLLADGTLDAVATVPDEATAMRMLDQGDAAAAIIVPDDYDKHRLRGEAAEVQVVIDGTDPNRAGVAGGAASAFYAALGAEELAKHGRRAGGIAVVPRVFYNPRLITAIYMIPGTAAMLLVSATTLVTAMGFAREKEMGTFEQVLVTPLPPRILMIGKSIPYIGIGVFDVVLALAAGAWMFGLPIRGNLLVLMVATLLYLMSTLGVGLLISTISQTQQQAFLAQFLFVMPANMLSGNMTPIASMPWWLQPLTWFNPLRYYIAILRANLLKGAGFGEVWTELLALAVFGTVILTLATMRFRKTLA